MSRRQPLHGRIPGRNGASPCWLLQKADGDGPGSTIVSAAIGNLVPAGPAPRIHVELGRPEIERVVDVVVTAGNEIGFMGRQFAAFCVQGAGRVLASMFVILLTGCDRWSVLPSLSICGHIASGDAAPLCRKEQDRNNLSAW
jgi:hypothetical protein